MYKVLFQLNAFIMDNIETCQDKSQDTSKFRMLFENKDMFSYNC